MKPHTDPDREIDEELAFHHQQTVRELKERGLSDGEAEAGARRRFGPLAGHRRRLVGIERRRQSGARRRAVMGVIVMSLKSAGRGIRRSPGFTLGVIAILTLGLGVNAITFGLVDRLILSGPASIERADELRRVVVHRTGRTGGSIATTELGYLDYRDLLEADLLAGAAAESPAPLLFGAGDSAEPIEARLVTSNYFALLGAQPVVGRFFTAEESESQAARLAVLSHAFWQRQFGGAPSVLGQVLQIESNRYTVVGVAPRYFTGAAVSRVDVFLPLEAASDEQDDGPWRTSRNFRWMSAIVRLAPGVGEAAAEAEVTERHRRAYVDAAADDNARAAGNGRRLSFVPLNAVTGETASGELGVAALVGSVALLVLLIAFANVANLFLARSLRRRDEVAIRMALGGGRARLIAEQAVEGAALALVGAAAAVMVAVIAARPVQTALFPDVLWLETPLSLPLLLLLGGLAVTGGALAAALPMWQAGRSDVTRWLKTGGQRVSRTRTQGAMTLLQGALSVVLLIGAGLFIRSLSAVQSLDLGIEADRLLVVSARRGEAPPRPDFREALRAAVDRIPGVERTTLVAGTIPFISSWAERLRVPDLPNRPSVQDGGPYIAAVEPDYFAAVGTSILEGRGFTADDRDGAPRVAVVNQTMARLYWPAEPAIGKCLEIGPDTPPCTRVVGVAESTRRQTIIEGDSLLYYVPVAQAIDGLRAGRLVVRAASADVDTAARISEAIRRQAMALEPGLRYVSARPLDAVIAPQLRAWRLGAGLFSVFGALALAVAVVGLYSVVAFDVEGRRRELGVRAALGASAPSLLRLVVGDGLKLAAGGLLLGLALAWVLSPLMADLLFSVPPQDATVYGIVLVLLLLAAVLASALPALRASQIDPSRALRDE